MRKEIIFEDLKDCDLIVDALYKGGPIGKAGDDPISRILRCGNQAGFRFTGIVKPMNIRYVNNL